MDDDFSQLLKDRELFASMLKHVINSAPDADPLPFIISAIGENTNAGRCYICLFRDPNKSGVFDVPCEWCAPGVESVKARMQGFDLATLPDYHRAIVTGCDYCFTDVSKINSETGSKLSQYGVLSLIASPLRDGTNSVIGLVVLDFVGKPAEKFSDRVIRNIHEAAEMIIAGHRRYLRNTAIIAHGHELEKQLQEEKKLCAALAQERDHAIEAEKAKSLFFSTVSHDIRTPLNAIIGFTELLRLGIADEAERVKALDSIKVSGQTLLELINDVLDLSKLEAGKMEIETEPTDCAKLVRETVASFEAAAAKKNLQLIADVGAMPHLEIDPQRIRQIIFNLVGNSMKFTERGHIKVAAEYADGTFSFSVEDTGCGISDEDQQKIASPYTQFGGGKGKRGGTGLGLAICKQLVFKMDGTMELSSELGLGTTFKVILPKVKTAGEIKGKQLTSTQIIRMMPSSTQSLRVLLVDDMPINLAVVKALLARLGVRDIVTAANGREALEKLGGSGMPNVSEATFDIVLSDMWMPELDGEGLVRAIRKIPRLATLPVYAITADVEAQKTCMDMGFNGVLLKPVTLEKLRDVIG